MKIYLIRHGRQDSPLCNVDVPLSMEGRRQAELLGERLRTEKVDAVWSSNLTRAMETADILNESVHAPRVIREGLREISFGELEGLSDAVIARRFEEFLRERHQMERDLPYPGGECAADVVRRAVPVMNEILHTGLDCVAVVTHGGVIRSLLCHYLGMDMAAMQLFARHLENCGMTELSYRKEDGRMFLDRFNDSAHLEPYPELLRRGWRDKK